jgi:integrase/recombinase XerD
VSTRTPILRAYLGRCAERDIEPLSLRHTFVTTMLDAGIDLRDVQIAARHADPRTTTRYDRARKNHHTNYILAAYMASGT